MGNTNAAALIPNIMKDIGLSTISSRLVGLSAFARNFTLDQLAPKKTVEVMLVSAGSTGQTNPTTWESGDSTRVAKEVTVNRYSKSFQCSSAESNQGFQLMQLVKRNAMEFGETLMDVALTPVTVANFTIDPIVAAQAAFGDNELAAGYAKIGAYPEKFAILDSRAYANFLSVDKLSLGAVAGRSGMAGIYENTRWTGAGANVYGLICNPDAVLVGAALPKDPPEVVSDMLANDVFVIEGLGLPVQYSVWVSRATKTVWASFDVMFGAALGVSAAGVLVKSA